MGSDNCVVLLPRSVSSHGRKQSVEHTTFSYDKRLPFELYLFEASRQCT